MKITDTKMNLIPREAMAGAIKSVGTRDKAFKTFVHGVACSAMFHMGEHGNAALLIQLGEKLSRPSDRKALIDWALAHAPLMITDEGLLKVKTGWKVEDFDFAGMVDTTLWDFSPPRKTKAITLATIASYVADKGAKAVKKESITAEQFAVLMDAFDAARALVEEEEVEVTAAA